jgi:hypothetical protein
MLEAEREVVLSPANPHLFRTRPTARPGGAVLSTLGDLSSGDSGSVLVLDSLGRSRLPRVFSRGTVTDQRNRTVPRFTGVAFQLKLQ